MTGLEPATSGTTNRRSNQLNYTHRTAHQTYSVRAWEIKDARGSCQAVFHIRRIKVD